MAAGFQQSVQVRYRDCSTGTALLKVTNNLLSGQCCGTPWDRLRGCVGVSGTVSNCFFLFNTCWSGLNLLLILPPSDSGDCFHTNVNKSNQIFFLNKIYVWSLLWIILSLCLCQNGHIRIHAFFFLLHISPVTSSSQLVKITMEESNNSDEGDENVENLQKSFC